MTSTEGSTGPAHDAGAASGPAIVSDFAAIERFLRRDPYLHLYGLGDLDDLFRPRTKWYASMAARGEIRELALLYAAGGLPALLALSRAAGRMTRLVRQCAVLLPDAFYAHLSPGVEAAFDGTHALVPHGAHLRMALTDPAAVGRAEASGTMPLGPGDLGEVRKFYDRCYPGNWFDPAMLGTGMYRCIREGGRIASIAGVHVFSGAFGAAALGNVATDPDRRNRGLGTRVTASVCRVLLDEVPLVGLNVRADNAPAIACYRRLGFTEAARYGEFEVRRRNC